MRSAVEGEFEQLNRRFRPALMAFFLRRIGNHKRPYHIAIAADDGVRAAKFVRLVRIQRGVYPAKNHGGTPASRRRADFISP